LYGLASTENPGNCTNCVSVVEPGLDDIVLSSEKMTDVIEIDKVGGTAIVEAVTVLQTVQETVALGHMADRNLHIFVALMEDGDFHTASESGPEQHPQQGRVLGP